MNSLKTHLLNIREQLAECAFLVAKKTGDADIHAKLIDVMLQIQSLACKENADNPAVQADTTTHEVKKVKRRLELWAQRQEQVNSKILNAYLRLVDEGNLPITVAMLENEVSFEESDTFQKNFNQMKLIADRNHGKIFDVVDDAVSIWPPVDTYVKTYAKSIRQN